MQGAVAHISRAGKQVLARRHREEQRDEAIHLAAALDRFAKGSR